MFGGSTSARAMACGLGIILGCTGSSVFLCGSDGDCRQGDVSGVCQATGYCSFPDDTCESGQRYGVHVGGSLAEACVELPGETEATSDDEAGTSRGSTSSPLTSTTTTSSTGLDGAPTTEPLDDEGTSTTTGDGSSGEVGSTSAGGVECWVDDFADGMIAGEWCIALDPGIVVDEPRGHLRFELLPMQWGMGMGEGAGDATTCDAFPLLGSSSAVLLASVPQVSNYTEAFLEVGNDARRLGLAIQGGELYAFVWNGMAYGGVSWQPYMPAAHRWLRVSGTDQGLVAEYSHDGVAWVHVYTSAADLSGDEGQAAIGTWAAMVPLGPDEASFEEFERCTGLGG